MDKMDWAVIIAAVISFAASIITIIKSEKIQVNSAEFNRQLTDSQIKSLDKQRIVGNIGTQRIEWVNKTRDVFVEYNTNLSNLSYINSIVNDDNLSQHFGEIKRLSFELKRLLNLVELLLNPMEPYTRFLLVNMSDANSMVIRGIVDNEKESKFSDYITFTQNVILKAEWKRVKDETERGEFLNEEEMGKVFEEVGKDMNEDTHNLIMGKYRRLD